MHSTTARALLGVTRTANAQSIKRAFRERAFVVHPDRGGEAKAFQRLIEAQRVALESVSSGPFRTHGPDRWLGPDRVRTGNRVHRVDCARRVRQPSPPAPGRSFAEVLAEAMAAG